MAAMYAEQMRIGENHYVRFIVVIPAALRYDEVIDEKFVEKKCHRHEP